MHLTILVPLASVNLSTVATSSIVPWKHINNSYECIQVG